MGKKEDQGWGKEKREREREREKCYEQEGTHMIRRRIVQDRVPPNPFIRHLERRRHLAINHRSHRGRRHAVGAALARCGRPRVVVGRGGEGKGCSREGGRDVVLAERAAKDG